MTDVDYDPVYDRLDAMIGEPDEPGCWDCYGYRRPGTFCRACDPSPRQRRRERHREWQRRDRASRQGPAAEFDRMVSPPGSPF